MTATRVRVMTAQVSPRPGCPSTANGRLARLRRRISLDPMAETTLSRTAYERLQAELEDLTTRGRVEIAQQIEAARALGDLSENGDYHAAKDSQGKMEARIRQLEQLLSSATVIEGGDASGA